MKWLLILFALTGCAAPAVVEMAGAVTCSTFSTLTTRATVVYIAADRPGTVVVQSDCTIAATQE